ncbi:MAG: Gfo/Idh/MocA family oxidoreductase [Bryobacteraceae bacterium]|nr:Gfo/Idh/MocA family oxidoreductase [Bryobacteraceae bacterium]
MDRRRFLASVSAAAAAAKPARAANDRIRLGFLGLGGRGAYEIRTCLRKPETEIAAVCDVYQPFVDEVRKTIPFKVDGYQDFRRILDRKDIDAVFVSTPDHWHVPMAMMAFEAGKDVYCEKPLTHTIDEGRALVRAARHHKKILQTGSQQRSAEHFQKCVEMIQGGVIGKVTHVEAWNHSNEAPVGIGNPKDSAPPPGLDWDLYLGPASKVPYNTNRWVWNYRWFWEYSGGMMTDWGAHHVDIVHWAMNVDAPNSVAAFGGKYVLEDNRETPDTLVTVFEYPGFTFQYRNTLGSGVRQEGRAYGMAFRGTKGTLILDRSSYEIRPEMRGPDFAPDRDRAKDTYNEIRQQFPAPGPAAAPMTAAITASGFRTDPLAQEAHVQNWLNSLRSRKLPNADVEIGHRVCTACHLGVIAYRTGRRIVWDGEAERIVGDADAQKYTSKQYRAPFSLPKV